MSTMTSPSPPPPPALAMTMTTASPPRRPSHPGSSQSSSSQNGSSYYSNGATRPTSTSRSGYASTSRTNPSVAGMTGGSTSFVQTLDPVSRSAPTSPSGRLGTSLPGAMSPISYLQLEPKTLGGPSHQQRPSSSSASSSSTSLTSSTSPPQRLSTMPSPSHSQSHPHPHPHIPLNAFPQGPVRPLFFSSKPSDPSQPSRPHPSSQPQPQVRAKPRQPLGQRYTSGMMSDDSAFDSDTTVRPGAGAGEGRGAGGGAVLGAGGGRTKQSLSQPDLTLLRSKRTEGWADELSKGQSQSGRQGPIQAQGTDEKGGSSGSARRPSLGRTKTPPSRSTAMPIPIPIPSASGATSASAGSWLPASPNRSPGHTRSKSSTSISNLRRSPSPRSSALNIPIMSPITSKSSLSSSPDTSSPRNPFIRSMTAGTLLTGSEDADDDYESTDSPSSGSLTFSPKRTRSLRRRFTQEKPKSPASGISSLGLSLGTPEEQGGEIKHEPLPLAHLERIFQRSSLLSLRLLAIVPSLWGICVLLQALFTGGLWHDVWPWGVDLSTEALERLVQGDRVLEGTWREVSRGDMLLSIAWAICTAHFCFYLTTGLTYRWRSYYSLPSTITRLVSLQCLCWPATYLTLWFLGAQRPLLAWVVIGVTTGWSRTIQIWVTSNVVPSESRQVQNEGGGGVGGDVTPNGRKRSPAPKQAQGPPVLPEGLTAWETFTYGRKWDWDAVARKVGWKVGGLLLITTAWLFWGIEEGRVVRG